MRRRQFLNQLALASVAGSLTAREPILRTGPARFQLGLAAYSLRQFFAFSRGKAQKHKGNEPLDMSGFLKYCATQGFDAAELTSYFFPPEVSDDALRLLKQEAFLQGVAISGTAIGNNFTIGRGEKLDTEIAAAKAWIDKAAIMGAPHIRFFAGTGRDLDQGGDRLDVAIEALEDCAQYAATKGIFVGVENHGNLTAPQMLEIMRRAKNSWIGINLDTGNFYSDDPYADLEECAPYAVNVQVKVTMKDPSGKSYPADLDRVGKILKSSGYQGYVILEYEDEDPYERIPPAHEALRKALGE